MKNSFKLLLSLIVLVGFVLFFETNIIQAEPGSPSDPCCTNGYKTWKDPGIFGGGHILKIAGAQTTKEPT